MSGIALAVNFALPKGWTANMYRSFLQSELQEDFASFTFPKEADAKDDDDEEPYWCSLVDYDDKTLIFTLDWGDDYYSVAYSVVSTKSGKDLTYSGDPVCVGRIVSYIPIAEMSIDERRDAQRRPDRMKRTEIAQFAFGDANAPSVNASSSTDYVIRKGKVFEVGDYPDKAAEIGLDALIFTPDDLKLMASTFKSVPNRVSHANGEDRTRTIFDQHMGSLVDLELDEDGNALIGTIQIPRWLDEFQKSERGGPLQASLEIDPYAMRVTGNTLVPNPRIATSALMSAYAAFSDRGKTEGKVAEQNPEKTAPQVDMSQYVSKADHERLLAQFTAQQAETRKNEAASFADAQIREGKAVPAQREHLVSLFSTASEDDAATPRSVNFAGADGKTASGSRVDALKAAWTAAPKLMITRELMPGDTVIKMSNPDDTTREKQRDTGYEQGKKYAESLNKPQANGR